MDLEIDEKSSSKTYSSELATQEKVIIRIKKQEQDVDIEGIRDSSTDQEEIVSYTCEFVQKVDDTQSESEEFDDSCDEPIDSIRQDENFIYPAITNSDDENTNDLTWEPPSNILKPRVRMSRRNNKCVYPKDEQSLQKKKKYKKNKDNEELTIKRLKKDTNVLKPSTKVDKSDDTSTNKLVTKKVSDSLPTKVNKPRKGMATPKQRLARIIKMHKMMK